MAFKPVDHCTNLGGGPSFVCGQGGGGGGEQMRILIAGATGAIGRPLIRCLNENRHIVFGLARSPQSSRAVAELGAEPVTADALDAGSVKAAITRVGPDAAINELTVLPRHYTAAEM